MVKNFFKFAIGAFATFVVGLLTTSILTRMISPIEMGKASYVSTVALLAISIFYLGMDQCYIRFYYDVEQDSRSSLLLKCIKFPVIITSIFSVSSLLLYKWVTEELVGESSFLVCVFFVLRIYITLLDKFVSLSIRMKQMPVFYSIYSLAKKVGYLVVAVILYHRVFADSYKTLVVGIVISEGIIFLITAIIDFDFKNCLKNNADIQDTTLLKYGLPFVLSTAITYIFHSTDKFMLKYLSDYYQIGLYSGAHNIVNLLTQVQAVFLLFWSPIAYKHFSQQPEEREFYVKANDIVTYFMMVIGLALVACKDYISLLLGSQYRDAAFVFPFLAFMPIMYTISETTVLGINFTKKTKVHIYIALISAVVNMIGNYYLILLYGAKGAAISTGLSYVVFFLLRTMFSQRLFPIPFHMGKIIVALVITYSVGIASSFMKTNSMLVIVDCIALLLLSILYKNVLTEVKKYLAVHIKQFKEKKILKCGNR